MQYRFKEEPVLVPDFFANLSFQRHMETSRHFIAGSMFPAPFMGKPEQAIYSSGWRDLPDTGAAGPSLASAAL
jgi:hypothetical protein